MEHKEAMARPRIYQIELGQFAWFALTCESTHMFKQCKQDTRIMRTQKVLHKQEGEPRSTRAMSAGVSHLCETNILGKITARQKPICLAYGTLDLEEQTP
jgi:hypothetical protein